MIAAQPPNYVHILTHEIREVTRPDPGAVPCMQGMTLAPHQGCYIGDRPRASDPPSVLIIPKGTPMFCPPSASQCMPMSAGRCSFSTEWRGKFYADPDFTDGDGGGRPRPGAKPCS